jgi:hypothetical protein
MVFNYKSEFTRPWLQATSKQKFGYRAQVRKDNDLSIAVDL